ncbi:MAG TPA: aromatic ring-opening dioxygenase LigA [Lacisediminihabitans sp.]|uniref:aromatic ring-opening dioxygenase LigA n=1 Tax=Lacisediminihabitans sp. TaxID=2787631 RepID=UPI002EDA1B95
MPELIHPFRTTLTIGADRASAIRSAGVLGMIGGAALIATGSVVWAVVRKQLRAEKITVSPDSPMLAGAPVEGPFTALAEANIINQHALAASKGKTFAELPQDDPIRATLMNGSFLRTSLFTSVVSFGVSAFAIGAGILVGVTGWGLSSLASAAIDED